MLGRLIVAGTVLGVLTIAIAISSGRATAQAGPASASSIVAQPHLLDNIAAVVEADVVQAQYLYDDAAGPRTQVTLANIVVRRGTAPDASSFVQFGGPLPSGEYVRATDLPSLNPGSHYVLFIMGGPWFFTPIWANLAFRVESVGGRSLVVAPDGFAVTHFGSDGIAVGTTQLVDFSKEVDPTSPRAAAVVDPNAADLKSALDVPAFIAAANTAIDRAGGLSTMAMSFRQSPRTHWYAGETSPATTP